MTTKEKEILDEIIKQEISNKSPATHCNFSRFNKGMYPSENLLISNKKIMTGSFINERANRNSK